MFSKSVFVFLCSYIWYYKCKTLPILYSIKSLEGMGSSSHDLGAELRMHSITVNCDTFSNEEKVAAVVPVTNVEVSCSEAMLALSFYTLMVTCLMKILGRSALG